MTRISGKSVGGISRRKLLGAAAAAAAMPSLGSAADDRLTKLWVRYVTGGVPYRPSFAAIFLDPMFLEMEVGPSDLPNNLALTAPPGGRGGAGRGSAGMAGAQPSSAVRGGGNAPAIIADNPPDLPWIPSTSVESGVRTLLPNGAPIFNVLLLNDQTDWPDAARQAVQANIDAGKGFVLIHHSLGDNQTWPFWYREITGGLLVLKDHDGLKKSTVTENATIDVRPAGTHPIVQDLPPMRLVKETAFKGMWQSPRITPLLQASGSASDRTVAWIGPSEKARVVCIQPGAATETHRNAAYRKLVRNALLWVGGRLG